MSEEAGPSKGTRNTSKELLAVTGDGSCRSVLKSLLKQQPKAPPANKPKTFMVARSPLLDQLQAFLPELQKSNEKLMAQPTNKLESMDIENTEGDQKVIEMNVIMGAMASDDDEEDSDGFAPDLSDSESDDSLVLGPVTSGNLRLPTEARGGRKRTRNLIQVVSESRDDRSDGEVTVASTSSGER